MIKNVGIVGAGQMGCGIAHVSAMAGYKVHIYDLSPETASLPEATKQAPAGARDGQNDWGKTGYGGPCPPIGRHRYFHKLYALDTVLGDRGALKKAELEAAMKGHVLGSAELLGTYQKKKR